MIGTDYQVHGIFYSPEPSIDDLIQAYNVYGVRYILSLDRDASIRVANRIRQRGLPIQQISFPINAGYPAGEASTFFNNALSFFSRKPILVHCRQGKDRTGFAIAAWLIKSGRQTPCGAVDEVTARLGYGTGGISQVAKMTMDKILGCVKTQKEEDVVDQLIDQNTTDDIATQMREQFAHQQGSQSAGTVDGGYWADQIGFGNNWSDPDRTYPGGTVNTNIREARKRLWKRLIKVAKKMPEFKDEQLEKGIKFEMRRKEYADNREAAKEVALDKLVKDPKYYDKLEDKNDSFLGGGPQGSPTAEELPSGQASPAIPGVGLHDNYTGISSHMNQPSGAPGAPNAASPVMPAQPNLTS